MSRIFVQILRVFIVLLIPLLIVLGAVRLVGTEQYLAFEYSKNDFPGDPFGFDRNQRLVFATANLQFVTQSQSLAALAAQNQNGVLLYNARELKHMQDVQNVYQTAWRVWQVALVLVVLSGLALAWRKENRPVFASALIAGGAITAGLVLLVGLIAIVAWQAWFVIFHQVFFAAGSWTFDNSNTLIRLFPEKFWYDAALTISSLSLIAGSLVYWAGTRIVKIGNRKSDWDETVGQHPLNPASHQQGS